MAKKKNAKSTKPTGNAVDLAALEKKSEELVEWMLAHPIEVIKERQAFQEKMLKKRCIYGRSLLPTTLIPMFMKRESLDMLQRVSVIVDRIIDKAIDLYFQEQEVREYFPYSQIPREWIEADPGYSKPTVINRHDALFDGKTLKFIEFNTDNPGGKGWTDVYEEIFFQQPLYKDLIEEFGTWPDRKVIRGYHQALLRSFNECSLGDKPRIALVDFREISNRTENEIIRDYFIEQGIEANLVDVRDFELKNGRLYSNNVRFDLAVRALTAQFYLRFPRETKDFIQAITSKAVCLVNSFRAILGSEKALLSFLTNPFHHHYFTKEEVEVIEKHIPWTRKLDETITLSPQGEEIELQHFIRNNHKKLVLKPSWGAGGEQVMVGMSTERAEWEACIDEHIGSPWWIVQECVDIPSFQFPVIRGNKVVLEDRYVNFSPFVFGGEYVGVLGRTSGKDVINVSAQGGVIPVFPVKGQ